MGEEWKPIAGQQGYFISSHGRVWSERSKRIMTPVLRSKTSGYYAVVLRNEDKTQRTHNIHRLVAEAFIPNPLNKETVNHIDGNKKNNVVDNLEWATRSENDRHAFRIGLRHTNPERIKLAIDSRKRKVINLDTGEKYESISECARAIGGRNEGIYKCVRGIRKRYMGMRFAYLKEAAHV